MLTGKLDRYLADLNEQAQKFGYELIEAQMRNCGWSYRGTEESESYGMGATVQQHQESCAEIVLSELVYV